MPTILEIINLALAAGLYVAVFAGVLIGVVFTVLAVMYIVIEMAERVKGWFRKHGK